MYVRDIVDDAKSVLGNCNLTEVYRRLSDATRRMANKGIFDPAIAEMDLCVCDGCISLPSDVGTVLAVNVGGHPTLVRDEFFHYHINGPGDQECQPWELSDERGMHCTLRDPSAPVYLVTELTSAADNNRIVRVYGWDVDGKRIWTPDSNGVMQDGFLVPTIFGISTRSPVAPAINRIDRIHKDVSADFIKLVAIDPNTLAGHTLLGYYQPSETDPQYRRIHVKGQSWVRIKYKKANPEITSINDWIGINNREALLQFLKAVKFDLLDRHDVAGAAETVGTQLLNDEVTAKRPKNILTGPQIVHSDWPADQGERMFF